MMTRNDDIQKIIARWGTESYYANVFPKTSEGKLTWNWAAALFPFYWLVMHKMYRQAGLLVLFTLGVSCFGNLLSVSLGLSANPVESVLDGIISGVLALYFGLQGNRWLLKDLTKKLQRGADPDTYAFVNNMWIGVAFILPYLVSFVELCQKKESIGSQVASSILSVPLVVFGIGIPFVLFVLHYLETRKARTKE